VSDMIWKTMTEPYLRGRYMTRGQYGVQVISCDYGDWRLYTTTNGVIDHTGTPAPSYPTEREAMSAGRALLLEVAI